MQLQNVDGFGVETGLLRYYPSNPYPVNYPTFIWRISGDYPSNGGESACRRLIALNTAARVV